MRLRGSRALLGIVVANLAGAVLLLATVGALAAAQPATAHGAVLPQEHPAQRLAPATNSLTMAKLVNTGSGDNSVVFNGDQITYTVVITNNSSSASATNIQVIDKLPLDTLQGIVCFSPCQQLYEQKQIPEPTGGTLVVTVTRSLSWTVATLAPLATTQLMFGGRVVGQSDGTVFHNRAQATYAFGSQPGSASTNQVNTTVHIRIGQSGQPSLATAPTWFSSDLGGTLSEDWGDFNGDGSLDLVLGSSLGTSVYINVGGKLQPYWNDYNLHRPAYGVRWADVNHSGKLSIVTVGDSVNGSAVATGTSYIYGYTPLDPNNKFTQMGSFTTDFQMVRVAVGDFTGNKNVDIIASTNSLNAPCPVQLFRNDGAGNFSLDPAHACVSTAATAALGPGDFDNSGKLGLAVGLFPNTIEILQNDGTGNFNNPKYKPFVVANNLPFLPYDFAWGQYDGSGFLSLAAAFPLQKEAVVYRNLGNGQFDTPLQPFRTSKFLSPLSVAWGDFNGDGRLDLLVADEQPKVYLNTGGAFNQAAPLTVDTVPGQVWSARAEQVKLNGDLNIALTNRDSSSLLFDAFAPHLATSLTPLDSSPASSLAIGDADGNGMLDLLLGAGPSPAQDTTIHYNTSGVFPNQLTLGTGLGPQSVAFGDVTGSGQLAIAVGTAVDAQVYLAGQLNPLWTATEPNFPNHIVSFCDLNGDGKLDLLVGANGGGVAVYMNQGGTLAAAPSFVTPETGDVRAIACTDFNHEKYPGFAVAFYNQPAQVYQNNKNGTFTSIWNSGTHSQTTTLAWSDFDGSGFPSLAVGNYGQGTQIYENVNGQLQTTPVWSSPTQWNTTSIAWGDWKNDGFPDLAIGNDNQAAQVYGNLGSSPGQPRLFWLWTSADTHQTTGVAWGDFSGDGYLDLGLSQKGNCCNGYYRNGTITPSHLNANFGPTQVLPNNPSYLSVKRPGNTADGYDNSASEILGSSGNAVSITVHYTLYDPNGSRLVTDTNAPGNTIASTFFEYSLDGGGSWQPASPAGGWPGPVTTTSRLGQSASFFWDIVKDQAISDNALFRIRIVPFVPAGPVQRGSTTAISPPFRVRGVTCVWPEDPTILVSPNPPTPSVASTYIGSVSAGTGALTYTWAFGDQPDQTIQGQVVQHTFLSNGNFPVTMTVSGDPCPQNRDVVATRVLQVGTGIPNQNLYLPIVMGPAASAAGSTTSAATANPSIAATTNDNAPPAVSVNYPSVAPTLSSTSGQITGSSVALSPRPSGAGPGFHPSGPGSPSDPISATQVTTLNIGINNEPTLNGDGSRVAFWSTANPTGNNADGSIEVFTILSSTSGLRVTQITSSTGSILGGFNLSPSIDNLGKRIAFFSDRDLTGANTDQSFQIFLYDTSTGVLTQVTHTTKGFNILPSLSGDGNYIAFASDRDFTGANPNAATQIFRAQILPSGAVTYTQVTHTSSGTNDTPRINHDGSRIAFVSTDNLTGGNPNNLREVFLADVTPSGQVTFTQVTSTIAGNTGEPAIDGDGQRIAYVSDQPSGVREIFYADVDASHQLTVTQVTNDVFEVGNDQPTISSDGTRIGFVSTALQQVRVYDTFLVKELTPIEEGGPSLNPSLSGDGTVIGFTFNRQLYLTGFPLAGLHVTKTVAPTSGFQSSPVTYTVVVSNAGPSAATNVMLTDTVGILTLRQDNRGRFVGSPILNPAGAGTCGSIDPIHQPITCTLGTLAANAAVTLTLNVTPTSFGTLTNTAVASTDTFQRVPQGPVVVSLPVKPLPVGAVDLLVVGPPTGTSDISSTFVASVSPITASVPLTYIWQVSNQIMPSFTFTSFTYSDTESFTWDPGGVQTVTVFVSNAANNVVSSTTTITIFNPLPQLASLFPTNALILSPTMGLSLTGTGFVQNSSVLWDNGAQTLDSGFVTTSSLTATVPASLLQAVGANTITVQSPGPGGGLSGPLTFTVLYPAPTITALQPVTVATGSPAFTLTITGSNFFSGTSITWNGQPITLTTFGNNSATSPTNVVTAVVPSSYLLTPGPLGVTAINLPPNAGPSNTFGFTITAPTLSLSVNPLTIDTAQTATLVATISDVQAGARTITLTPSNPATIIVPATITLPPQTASVSVPITGGSIGGLAFITGTLPANIGGGTGAVSITVNYRQPVITSTAPPTTTAGGLTFNLTLTGSNFASGAHLFWDGQPVSLTTAGSGSTVNVSVPFSYIPNPGQVTLTVVNPQPNDGPSVPFTYTVVSPTISLSPSSLSLGVNQTATLTATISAPQAGPRTLTITASSNFVTVPPTIVLPAGATSTTFTFTAGALGNTGFITATLPDSLGGLSGTSFVSVSNPGPTIIGIAPNPITVTIPVTLDITGSGFVGNTSVTFDSGSIPPPQILSSTELLAGVPVDLYPTAGTYTVTVTNPAPGGGTFTATVQAVNPVPQVFSLDPVSTTAGTSSVLLSVSGSQFVTGVSTIYWNGLPRPTTFGSSTLVSSLISGTDLAVPDVITVTVVNSGPGGGQASSSLPFTVTTTGPDISAISPLTAAIDGGPFTLVVTGTNFFGSPHPKTDSVIQWNNGVTTSTLPTTFVSPTVLTATINPATLMPTAGLYTVTVFNPDPPPPGAGQLSNFMNLTATNPAPLLNSISPTFTTAGSLTLTLTLNGDKFVQGASTALWNNTALNTAFVSRNQLTATVEMTRLTTAGFFTINVQTTGPGGGLSQPLTFTVNNLAPTLTNLNPKTAILNHEPPNIKLVVNGTNFVDGALVLWTGVTNTTSITPTALTSTTLTATVLNKDFPVGGIYTVTVLNPPPPTGGILSTNSLTVTVNNPRPGILSIVPNTTVAGTGALSVTVTGNGNIVAGATGRWNGSDRPSIVDVTNQLITMTVLATDVNATGTFTISVHNPDPSLGDSTAVNNFTVTDQPIAGLTAANSSPTPLGGTVSLTATTTAGTNISFAWDFGDGSGTTTNNVAVSHTYPAVGASYTAVVTATNAVNQMTASTTVTITNPTVSLAPASQVIALTNNGALTATISNAQASSTVISLTSSSPLTVSVPATITLPAAQTQATFTLTTHSPATGQVTITAQLPSALGGGVSNVVTATVVDQPIAGLAAANSSPTPLGGTTNLTATTTAGTNVTYLWDFGDGTGTSTTNPVTHAYPLGAGGLYTAVVTATNSINQVTATTVVTINNPTPAVTAISPVTPTATLTQSQVITVTGTGFITGAQVEIQSQVTATISSTYLATVDSPTQLRITAAAGDIPSPGPYNLWVINPEPPVAIAPRTSNKWVFNAQ